MFRSLTQPHIVLGSVTLALAIVLGAPGAHAQVNNPFATGGAEASIQGGSATGGLNATTFTNRANTAAGQANNRSAFVADQGLGPGNADGPSPGAIPGPPGNFPGPGQPVAPIATPVIPTVRVLVGERVYSAIQFGTSQPELLEDAEIRSVPAIPTELNARYYDDGTNGDVKAKDNIWSNVKERNDVMSPQEFRILTQMLAALRASEQTEPFEFFRVPVSTSEPLSTLPQNVDLETKRDAAISDWNKRQVRDFRINKEDPSGPFWPLFVPPPPPLPDVDLPAGYNPSSKEVGGPAGVQGGGGASGPGNVGARQAGTASGVAVTEDGMPVSGKSTYFGK